MTDHIHQLKTYINNAQKITVLTGAGISAESGIPTYRGAGRLWTQYDPNKYANITYFMQDPGYYWRFFKKIRYPLIKKSQPNPAHKKLATLEQQGKLAKVITQNIDGLHQLAGNTDVIELHGNTRRIICMTCKKEYSMDEIYTQLQQEPIPYCSCNGLLRPDVIFFGETLSHNTLQKAYHTTQHCELFLVIGSSLVVNPAASLLEIAKLHGKKVVIINIDATPLDAIADLVIHSSASKALNQIIK